MAQRDSAVSGYKPCAEEPPALSACLLAEIAQDTGGTRSWRNLCREEFYQALFPDKKRSRTEDISSLDHFFFFSFYLSLHITLLIGGTAGQPRSLLDERELGTSLGKTERIYFMIPKCLRIHIPTVDAVVLFLKINLLLITARSAHTQEVKTSLNVLPSWKTSVCHLYQYA